jgi:Flp pilus assembly protein TadD
MTPGLGWDAFNLPKLALLWMGVAVALSALVLRWGFGGRRFRTLGLAAPGAALGLALLVSWVFSPYRDWSWLGQYTSYQGLLPYLLVIALGLLAADRFRDDPRPLAHALLAGSTTAALYGVIQWAGWDPLAWEDYGGILEAASTLGNPNYSGSVFALCLPLAFGMLRASSPARRAWVVLSAAVLLAGLLVSDSQIAWVAAVGGSAVVAGSIAGRRFARAPIVGVVVAALCALAVVAGVVATLLSDSAATRSMPLRDRGWYWVAAGGTIAESPVIGNGPDSFVLEGQGHRVVEEGVERGFAFTFDPHSAPLMLAASNGIVALVAFGFVIMWITRRVSSGSLSPLTVAFLAPLVSYLIQSLGSTEQLTTRAIFWTCLAGLAVATEPSRVPSTRSTEAVVPGRALVAVAFAAIVGVLSLLGVSKLLRADREVYLAMTAAADGDPVASALHMSRAVSIRDDAEYRKLLGAAYGRLAVANRDNEDGQTFLRSARAAYAYTETIPDAEAVTAYGSLLHSMARSADDLSEAEAVLRRAVRLDPVNPLPRVALADVMLARGEPDEAYAALRRLFFFFPPQASYWGALSLTFAGSEDWDAASDYAEHALSIDPDEPRARRALDLVSDAEGSR